MLGTWEGAAIGIGVAIGAGIFRTPGYVAGFLDAPWVILAAWAVGGLFVVGDSLILAELATRVPRAGGWYVYIEKGWGRFPAFVYGWTYMLVVDPASSAALVVVLGEYLQTLAGLGPVGGRIAAMAVTLALFGSSLAGIKVGSRVQDALTYTKLIALVGVAVLAFLLPTGAPVAAETVTRASGLLAFCLALQGVLWTFEGYANTTTMTEESVNPRRTLPKALVLGSATLGATYLLVNGAYLHVLGRDGLQASTLPGADLSYRLFGSAGTQVFLVLAILAAIGSLNGAALSAPRVTYALARSGLAPEPFTRVTRLGTPDLATLWFAVAWCVYSWFGSFEGLVSVSIFVGALCNIAVTVTVFFHRARDRHRSPDGRVESAGIDPAPSAAPSDTPRPEQIFLSPFYPFLPLGMLVFWTVFAVAVLYDQGWKVGYGLLGTGLAGCAYFWIRRGPERSPREPDQAPGA